MEGGERTQFIEQEAAGRMVEVLERVALAPAEEDKGKVGKRGEKGESGWRIEASRPVAIMEGRVMGTYSLQ